MTSENYELAIAQFISNHRLSDEFMPIAKKHEGPEIEFAENFIDERGLTPRLQAELTEARTPDRPHNTLRAYDGLPITPDLTPERERERRACNWRNLRAIDYNAHQNNMILGRYILNTDEEKQLSVYQILRVTLLHVTIQALPHFLTGDPVHPEWGERTSISYTTTLGMLAARLKTEKRLMEDPIVAESNHFAFGKGTR